MQWLNFSERVGSQVREGNALKRMRNILLRPVATWQLIREEEGGLAEAFLPYTLFVGLVPLLIGSVLSAMVWGIFGIFLGPVAFSTIQVLLHGLATYLFWMLALLIGGKVAQLVAPSFQWRSSWVLSCRVLVYASTPSFIAGVFSWIPILGSLISVGALVWSVILMISGFQSVLKSVSDGPAEDNVRTVQNTSNPTIEVVHS